MHGNIGLQTTMIRNTLSNTTPRLVHAPGDLDFSIHWEPISRRLSAQTPSNNVQPADLSICTWNAGNGYKHLGQFESSLSKFGYKCDVLTAGRWTSNRIKIQLTVDYLKTVTTPYVLGADSSDVLLIRSLDGIIDDFLEFKCNILFNAEIRFWPPGKLEHVKRFEDSLPGHDVLPRYLNAGLWIGDTEYCLEFFTTVLAISEVLYLMPASEQVCVKYVYPDVYPKVQIDRSSKIFQNLNLQRPESICII